MIIYILLRALKVENDIKGGTMCACFLVVYHRAIFNLVRQGETYVRVALVINIS